jgi:hypothetical protein
MELENESAAQLSSATLVSLAGISEAIAKDDLSGLESRPNNFVNVLHP